MHSFYQRINTRLSFRNGHRMKHAYKLSHDPCRRIANIRCVHLVCCDVAADVATSRLFLISQNPGSTRGMSIRRVRSPTWTGARFPRRGTRQKIDWACSALAEKRHSVLHQEWSIQSRSSAQHQGRSTSNARQNTPSQDLDSLGIASKRVRHPRQAFVRKAKTRRRGLSVFASGSRDWKLMRRLGVRSAREESLTTPRHPSMVS